MKIIGISGQIASGKDEMGNYLVKKLNWNKRAFADAIKTKFIEMFGVDLEFIEKWKRSNQIPPGFKKTIRESLIAVGDGFRHIKPDVWIELLLKDLSECTIVSDARYLNEISALRKLGAISIFICKPDSINNLNSDSEQEIRPILNYLLNNNLEGVIKDNNIPLVDIFIKNDKDLNNLYEKIDNIILPYINNKF